MLRGLVGRRRARGGARRARPRRATHSSRVFARSLPKRPPPPPAPDAAARPRPASTSSLLAAIALMRPSASEPTASGSSLAPFSAYLSARSKVVWAASRSVHASVCARSLRATATHFRASSAFIALGLARRRRTSRSRAPTFPEVPALPGGAATSDAWTLHEYRLAVPSRDRRRERAHDASSGTPPLAPRCSRRGRRPGRCSWTCATPMRFTPGGWRAR